MRLRICGLWLGTALLCCSTTLTTHARERATDRPTDRPTPVVRAIQRTNAAVVNIHSEKTAQDKEAVFSEGHGRKVNGMGTGIIIDERGYIVTNQHVIAEVDSLRVTLVDGSTYTARIISYDRKHDLAVIKIDPTRPLQVIPLGTSSDLMLGETVVAIGNAFGYEHTATLGIISALSRDVEVNETQSYKNLIQTDAAINPGNSGGPLINLDGEVVGINVAIRAGAQRIGFAIPMDDARKYIARLLNTSRLNDTYHGLVTHDVKSPTSLKLVVDQAEPNSPAANAGFKPGDVVAQAGAVEVTDQADLERSLLGHAAGEQVEIVVLREQERVSLKLELGHAPNLAQKGGVQPTIRPAALERVEEQAWRMLGLKLTRATPAQMEAFRSRYRGGLRVTDVRADSPAARHGIRRGDILVGLHLWETVNHDNVSYVLNHAELAKFDPVKFYVIRGQETLFGHLRLTAEGK